MSTDASSGKPPIAQESLFTVEEGILYRISRTGAIWMNKLFFSALFLLALWLFMGAIGTVEPGCVSSPNVVETENGTVDQGTTDECSVWLSTTARYLGAMTVLSFIASIGFGLLGLVVGKNIMQMTPAEEEVGARREETRADDDDTS